MEPEQILSLLKILLEYIKQNDKEEAIFAVLDFIVNDCELDISELKYLANDEDETLIYKCITKFIKENGLDEEDEEEW